MKDKLKNFLHYDAVEIPGERPATIGDLQKANDNLIKHVLTDDELTEMMESAVKIEAYESAQKFKDELDRRGNERERKHH